MLAIPIEREWMERYNNLPPHLQTLIQEDLEFAFQERIRVMEICRKRDLKP